MNSFISRDQEDGQSNYRDDQITSHTQWSQTLVFRYSINNEKDYHTHMLDQTYALVVTKTKALITPEEAPYMAFTIDCWPGTTDS